MTTLKERKKERKYIDIYNLKENAETCNEEIGPVEMNTHMAK